jgi:hypothetical protein
VAQHLLHGAARQLGLRAHGQRRSGRAIEQRIEIGQRERELVLALVDGRAHETHRRRRIGKRPPRRERRLGRPQLARITPQAAALQRVVRGLQR